MQDQETDILSARESRIAIALFEMMKPQIKHFMQAYFEARSLENEIFWKEKIAPIVAKDVRENIMSDVQDKIEKALDENKSSDFDINDYTGEIEDIVGDWVRYNVTITSTID